MANYRPAVQQDDNYLQKIIKYIPAEIVAGYTVLTGYLPVKPQDPVPAEYHLYYLIVVVTLSVIAPVWTYFAVKDSDSGTMDPQRPWFHAAVALVAFFVWVYALGGRLLESLLNTSRGHEWYNTTLGTILLLLFTILTPLIERIVLGTKLPAQLKNTTKTP
jgi:hypothetical protein